MSGKEARSSQRTAKSAVPKTLAHDVTLQSQLAAIIEATPDGVALIDPQGTFQYVNPACRMMLGIDLDEPLSALTLLDFCSGDVRVRLQQDGVPTATREGQWSAEAELNNRTGGQIPVLVTFFAHKEPLAPVSLLSVILRDISGQKRREAELEYLADHDALTGLFNRRRFQEELESRLAQVRRYHVQGALLFIDVDGLKAINDTLGHQAGDAFLRSLATLLHDRLREVDVTARLGGDEFAVLIPTLDAQQAPSVAGRILQAVRAHTTRIGELPLRCTVSIGIALFPQHGVTAEDVVAHADLALYRAKMEGKNQYRMFSPAMKQ